MVKYWRLLANCLRTVYEISARSVLRLHTSERWTEFSSPDGVSFSWYNFRRRLWQMRSCTIAGCYRIFGRIDCTALYSRDFPRARLYFLVIGFMPPLVRKISSVFDCSGLVVGCKLIVAMRDTIG